MEGHTERVELMCREMEKIYSEEWKAAKNAV